MHRRKFLSLSGAAAIGIAGCKPNSQQPVTDAPVDESKLRELRVVLVDDASFAESLTRDWKSTSERPLKVSNVSAAELLAMVEIPADVVIYPPSLLGELAESGRIAPLDERTLEKPELAREEIIDLARVRLGNWGKRVFAIPLSAPSPLLIYRSEWIGAEPSTLPRTWQEFDVLCAGLPPERPAAPDPLAKESRSLILIARAASRARGQNQHSTLFDLSTMSALVDKPPFVRALEELAARAKDRVDETLTATTQTVWEQLVSGKASIGIGWPTAKSSSTEEGESRKDTAGQLRFLPLPGGNDTYLLSESKWSSDAELRQYPVLGGGGRLVSAIRTKEFGLREGLNLLVRIAGKARAESLGPLVRDAFPCRQSQLTQSGRWLTGGSSPDGEASFAEAIVDTLTASDYLHDLHLPGAAEYREVLDAAIEAVIRGEKMAEDSLRSAAESWNSITKKLGTDKQKISYLRSLGLDEFR
jgi:ABC-type glycerol-3-phosphate transport system substrate-binding protein